MGKSSYLEQEEEKPGTMEAHRKALLWLYQRAKDEINFDYATHVELFAGVGISSKIISEIFNPGEHIMVEKDEKCFNKLGEEFFDSMGSPKEGDDKVWTGLGVQIHNKDSYKITDEFRVWLPGHMSLDFPKSTILQFLKKKDFFEKVFENKPMFVDLTDTAKSYLHVHKKRYGEIVGKPIETFQDYIEQYSNLIYSMYGYTIRWVSTHGNSAHIGIMRGATNKPIEYHWVEE